MLCKKKNNRIEGVPVYCKKKQPAFVRPEQ